MPKEIVGTLIYLLGLALLFLELFVPSGGILGVVGAICTIYGIYEILSWDPWVGAVTIVATIAYVVFIVRFWANRVSMRSDLGGSDSTTPEASPADIVGAEGVTLTVLRPAGFAQIKGRRHQVVTDGSYLPKGQQIRVVEVVGNRIVVTKVEEPGGDSGEEAL